MRGMMRWGICAVTLMLAVPGAIRAQEAHENQGHTGAASEAGHSEFKSEVLLFVGNTRKSGHDAFTVGVDYGRVLKGPLILGLFTDYANSSSERDYILGGGLWFEVLPHLALFAGIGVERATFPEVAHHDDGHGEDPGSGEHHENHTVALGRFGATYAFHFGAEHQWVVAPQAFLDVVEGNDAWVLGVGLGYAF